MGDSQNPYDLGAAVATVRRLRGFSQEALAVASGVSRTCICDLETGGTTPNLKTVKAIAAALAVPLPKLYELAALLSSLRCGTVHGESPAGRPVVPDVRQEAIELLGKALADDAAAGSSLARSRRHAAELWAGLAERSEAERRALVLDAAEVLGAGFCELLCAESLGAAADSADRARSLADLAVLAAPRTEGSAGWRSRLHGYTLGHLMNAVRVHGDLPAAEALHRQAAGLWSAGAAADPGLLNEARFLHLEASLRRDQRRLGETLALLDRALAIDRWSETPALLVSKAKTMEETGDYAAAIELLAAASREASRGAPSRQRLLVRANLMLNLCYLGRHEEAEAMAAEVRGLARQLGNSIDLLRVRWIEGQVAAGRGRLEEALAALREVRDEFAARGIAYDAALATLQLAEVHAAAGDTAQVRSLARESAPIFRAQGVHREAQMACELFRRAAEQEAASVEMIRRFVSYLRRAKNDPTLRFVAGG